MNQNNMPPFYLCGPEKPAFVNTGLYAGYKHRDGMPSNLPISLEEGQSYTNTGFIDALSCEFLRLIEVKTVDFNINFKGKILISIYLLLNDGRIINCQDYQLNNETKDQTGSTSLAPHILNDPNGRLIFFKITALSKLAHIDVWSFSTTSMPDYFKGTKPISIISRSLGDSSILVEQFQDLNAQYEHTKKNYPNHIFAPFPNIVIYESDETAYKKSNESIESGDKKLITVKFNPLNLGGGGNMCVAVYEEFVKNSGCSQFIMIDSDTIIPLKTLYLSTILMAAQLNQNKSMAIVPTILYTEKPSSILESGALFGRGNWEIVADTPTQPCVAPLHHNKDLSDPKVKADISKEGYTDYPPFIYSIFTAQKNTDKTNFLPSPFFLRGDDIELGFHLRESNIPCQVHGWLTVFQQSKHSPWHEFMAILHGTCITAANTVIAEPRSTQNASGFMTYFKARAASHTSIMDLNGLSIYNSVLDRLCSLLEWEDKDVIKNFHDPNYYIEMRKLNKDFTIANYKMIEALETNSPVGTDRLVKLPCLYFDSQALKSFGPNFQLPEFIALMNQSNKTAHLLDTKKIDPSIVQQQHSSVIKKINYLAENHELLASKCKLLSNRSEIISDYLAKYSIKKAKAKPRPRPKSSTAS